MFRKTKGGKAGYGEVADEFADSTNPSLGSGETIPSNDSPDHYDETLIYSAPTVDTLGDEESLSRLYHSPRGQLSPLPNQKQPSNPNSRTSHVDHSIPPNTTPLMREDSVMIPSLSGSRPTSKDVKIAMSFSQDSEGSRSRKTNRIRRHRNLIQQQQDQEQERRRLRQQQLSKLRKRSNFSRNGNFLSIRGRPPRKDLWRLRPPTRAPLLWKVAAIAREKENKPKEAIAREKANKHKEVQWQRYRTSALCTRRSESETIYLRTGTLRCHGPARIHSRRPRMLAQIEPNGSHK